MNSEKEIELMHEEIREINKKLDRVLVTLLGDEQMQIQGLTHKVAEHDKYIQKQKLFMAKMSGIATAMGVLGSLLVQLVLKLIS